VIKIQDFLQPIKAAGGLYAYVVVCNSSNNTPDIIANGDLVVDVIIDAESVLPVKRLLLRATINRTGSRVTL
jgi:phage tail sheath protein FI